jgi:hypothetical protein
MYVRVGYFEGVIDGKDLEHFKVHVEGEVVPLFLKIPGIRDLRILWGDEFQDGAPPYILAVEHAYDSKQSLQAAREPGRGCDARQARRGDAVVQGNRPARQLRSRIQPALTPETFLAGAAT